MTKVSISRVFKNTALTMAASLAAFFATPQIASAQQQSGLLGYDDLSFFEEGLATDLGGAVLRFQFLLDQAYIDNPAPGADDWNTTLQFSTALRGELSNGWFTGVAYTGIFDTDDAGGNDRHLYSVFVDAPWGTLSLGRVTGLLENTVARRNRVGNATLAAGRGLGGLNETGLHYVRAVNAYQIHFAADEEGDAQAALFFEAPIGTGAHTFGIRGGTGKVQHRSPAVGTGSIEEIAGFYGYTLGSLSVGAELGMQDISLTGAPASMAQRYASLGTNYKVGRTSLSAELGWSRFMGATSRSAGLGVRYDIARGFSGNLGLNYIDAGATDTWRIPVSIRYEF
ncbi:MAG: hypothetical protein AAF231_11615 [Pseudomonadota bacterium]